MRVSISVERFMDPCTTLGSLGERWIVWRQDIVWEVQVSWSCAELKRHEILTTVEECHTENG